MGFRFRDFSFGGVMRLGIAILLCIWLLTLVIIREDRKQELNHARTETANLSLVLERHIVGTFSQIENALFSLRKVWEAEHNPETMQVLLKHLVASRSELFNLVSVIDSHGDVVMTDQITFKPTNSGDRPFFLYHRAHRDTKVRIGQPILGRVTGKWYIPVSMRVQKSDGTFAGVILASVNPFYFSNIFDEVDLGNASLICLSDNQGNIYSGMLGHKALGLGKKVQQGAFCQVNDPFGNDPIERFSIDNVDRIVSRRHINGRGMTVTVAVELNETLSHSTSRARIILFSQGIFTLVILFFMIRLQKSVRTRDRIGRELNSYFTSALELLCITDQKGNFIRINEEWERVTGHPRKSLIRHNILEFIHPDDTPATREALRKLGHQENILNFSNRFYCNNGEYRVIEWRSTPQGSLVFSAARDITDRLRAEEALKESELRFRSVFKNHRAVKMILDPEDGQIIDVNEAAEEFYGWSSDTLKQMKITDINTLTTEEVKQAMAMARENRKNYFEFRHRLANGTIRDVAVFSSRVVLQGKPLLHSIIHDITESRKMEVALRESEERFRSITENLGDLVALNDAKGVITYASPMMKKMFGYEPEEVIGCSFTKFLEEDYIERAVTVFRSTMETGRPTLALELKTKRRDGSTFFSELNGTRFNIANCLGTLVTIRDITDRKQAFAEQERLRGQLDQARKMESVGRLAGGIAHDFNNILTVILGHTELALNHLRVDEDYYLEFLEINKAAERAAELTNQLLAFARKQTVAPRDLDINDTVEGMLKMLRRLIGENIELAWLPGSGLGAVRMDPSQIDQILANLCVNARDAIRDTGRITIETDAVFLDDAYCIEHPGTNPGDYALLMVSDNGCGMDEDTLSRIFEPFFTTKELGKGTGLGLATIYGIVKQNNGAVNVYSEVGKGSTFKIYLPMDMIPMALTDTATENIITAGGTETILLVEDEASILRMIAALLEHLGYQVRAVSKPAEALELAKEFTDPIHLLITDVIMPDMNGRDLANAISSLHPETRKLFMSGYPANVIAHHGVLEANVHFLQKPFVMKELAQKVRDALDVPVI